ncbi:hypothetical protein [Leclercia adecarboxylata]|uniref:hypothetical protein n=1 Tax=Leclercia adecarboxylata TaxID=83655 RepID=UPI0021F13F11|nr:hypothetical protein [Leclercia adecarboxylata]UYM55128.1 hypothetical protein N5937_20720 [Leclercia adecarboxylata]
MRLIRVLKSDLIFLIKKLNNLSISNNNIRIIFYSLSFFAILVFVLYFFSKGDSSFSDLLSSISDVVMTICAITGLIFARSWFGQVVNDEGTKLSLKLLEIDIPKIKIGFFALSEIAFFNVSPLLNSRDNDGWATLIKHVDSYKKDIELLKESRLSVNSGYNSIRRRGISFTALKYSHYSGMLQRFDSLMTNCETICDCIYALKIRSIGTSSMYEALFFNRYSSVEYTNEDILCIFNEAIGRQFELISEYKKSFETFFSGDPHIKTYFKKV